MNHLIDHHIAKHKEQMSLIVEAVPGSEEETWHLNEAQVYQDTIDALRELQELKS